MRALTSSVDITITDESDQPVLELVPPTTLDGAESDSNKNRVFKVTKTGATELAASVTIATADGSATAPSDYTAIPTASQTLNFAKGDTEKSVTVTYLDDNVDELREDFSVAISSPTGAKLGTVTESTITITDDDPTKVQLEVSKLAIAEDGGTRDITVTLGRALESGETLPVTLTFAGTARFGTDYTLKGPDTNPEGVAFTNLDSLSVARPPTVTFTGGAGASSTATLTLTAADDNTDEGMSETVTVSLGALDANSGTGLDGGAKADATKNTQTFEITDDDTPGGITLTVDVDTTTDGAQTKVSEVASAASVQVTATIDGGIQFPAARTVTVSVGGGASTATSGDDYTAVGDFDITIPANTNSATGSFTLTPVNDGAKESDETILVTGAVPGESTLTVKPATITLIDFSVIPEISISSGGGVMEGGNASFTLASNEAIPIGLTVNVSLAQVGSFVAAKTLTDTTTVTIPANAASAKLSIATLGDAIDEIDGSVTVTVNAAGNGAYTIASKAGSAEVAVTDDDATSVALTATATSLTEGDTGTRASLGLQLGRDIAAGETIEVPLAITTSTGVPIAEANAADRDYILTATGGGVSLTGANTAAPKIRFTGAAGQVQSARLNLTATARDDGDEDNEALKVALGNLGAGSLATNVSGGVAAVTDNDPNTEDNSVEITIVDDEASKARISISVGSATTEGGSMGVGVKADPRPAEDITVHLNVIEADGSNYLHARHEEAQSFLLKKGIQDYRHTVSIQNNDRDEADGALTVTLVPDDAYRIATPDPITVIIRDNDATPLGFERVCVVRCNPIGENGGKAEFRVRLDRALDRANSTVTVPINVSGASVGTHYTLAVKPGQTGVSLVTTSPHSAQNPALRFGGAGVSEARFILTAVDNSDSTRRTVTLAPGTPTAKMVSGGVSLSASSSAVDVVIANDDGTPVVRVESFAPETVEGHFYDDTDSRTIIKTESTRPEIWVFADPVPQSDLDVSVTVTQEQGDSFNSVGSHGPGTRTLTIKANQAGPAIQVLDIENDQDDEPTGIVKLQVNSGQGYTVSPTMSSATMRVIDNDGGPTVSLAAASAKVTEGGDNIQINLTRGTEGADHRFDSRDGRSEVRLRITQRGDFVAAENLNEQTVVFEKGETTKTHVVPIVDDSMGEKDGTVTVGLLRSATRGSTSQYAVDYAPRNRAVITVADDDGGGPGVLIYNIDGNLDERKLKDTGSYQVELATDPGQTATLTVNVPAAHQDSVAVQAPGGTAGASATLTFTSGQGGTWDTPQTITLTTLIDDDGDTDDFSITHNIANYPGVTSAPDVPVTVRDQGYKVVLSRNSLEVAEPAGQETYGLHLLSAPKANVTITPASSDTELATVSGPITFTPTDWRQPKLVSVSGLKVGTLNVTHSITTTDAGYGALTGNYPVAVTVIADNRRTVNLAASPNPVAEGADVTLTATIGQAVYPARDVVIPLTYSDGTAAAADYSGAASLTIAAGKVSGAATVSITDDTAHETPDETFTAAFGALPRELLQGSTTSVEIAIDDAADVPRKVDLAVASSTVREGGEPATVDGATTYINTGFELTATLDTALNSPARAVTIPLTYTFGTAAAADIAQVADVTIPAGETSATVTIEVVNDSDFEAGNETFSIGLGALPDGVVAGTAGSVDVEIDDANDKPRAVSLSVAKATVAENSLDGGVELTATLDQTLAAPERAVIIPLTYTLGTAEAEDFTEVESLTIPAGETSAKVTIPVVDDSEYETPDETFTIGLGALPDDLTAGAKTEVEIAISDVGDAPRTVSFNLASDRAELQANASVGLILSRTLSKDVTIPLIVTLGSAEADDFNLAGSATIKANETIGGASLQIVDNDIYEGPETFTVTMGELPLDASELIKGEPDSQVNTITDLEDRPSFAFASNAQYVTVNEGDPELALVRTGKVGASSFLAYDISALPVGVGVIPGKDFKAVNHNSRTETAPLVEIPADDAAPAFPLPVFDDTEDEWEFEYILFSFAHGKHRGVKGNIGGLKWVRIIDDDPTPVTLVPSNDVSIDEDDTGGSTASLTLSFERALRILHDPTGRPNSAVTETATIPLVLSSPTGAGLPGSTNPDFSLAVTGNGVTASGLDSATPTITFTGNRTKPPGHVQEATITLTALGRDDGDYGDEVIEIALGDVAGASGNLEGGAIAKGGPVSVSIIDDEEGPDGFTLSVDTDSVAENAQVPTTITVTATAQDDGVFPADQELTITVGGGKDDTAVSGADYTAVPSFKISVPAGQSSASASFSLSPTNDALDEADETLSVTGAAGQLTIVPATVTITDDDPEPTVSVVDASAVSEGDDPATTVDMRFTASLSAASGKTVTVPYTLGGSATAGDDYTAPDPLSITIKPGATSADIVVPVKGDTVDELKETVEVTLGTPTNAKVGSGQGDGTASGEVNDDDETSVILSAAAAAIAENGGTRTITVTLGRALTGNETLSAPLTFAGTADFGVDYTLSAPNSTPTGVTYSNLASSDLANNPPTIAFSGIPNAARSATLTLTATADILDEDEAESVSLGLGALTAANLDGGAGGSGTASFNITDDDDAPVISIDAPSVDEGASGVGARLRFTVTLDAASGREVTVAYAEATGGTATQGTDYTALPSGTLTFDAGDTSKHIDITVTGDDIDEDNETVKVQLSSPSNATLFGGKATLDATGTITDDDGAPTVSVANASAVTEGNDPKTTVDMRFAVTLSAASSRTVTVPYTLDGTADEGDDYTAPDPTSLTISAGSTSANIVVPVKGDELDEANETVTVALGAPINATVSTAEGAGTATGTITDDESTPTATLILTPASIAESGATNASTVTASLSGASDQAVTLAVAAAAVSPAKSGDFSLSGSTLTIAAGAKASTGTVTVTAVDDKIDGPNKSVTVSATASGGRGVANPANATLTITDDDDAPTGIALAVDPASVAEDDGATAIEVTATTTGGTTYSAARTLAITVGGGASTATSTTDYTGAGFSMTLPAGQSSVSQSFNLTPVDDRIDEDSETIEVAGTTTGASLSPATVTLTDNDTRGVTVTGGPLAVLEADDPDTNGTREDQATYTVVLNSQPTDDVTINIGVPEGAPFTVSPTSLTFTPSGNGIWSSAQIVTVTAVDDDIDNQGDARSATITHSVVAGDSDYGDVTAAAVGVTVNDDDAAPTGITLTTDTPTIAENAATKTVKVTATVNGDTAYADAKTVKVTVGKSDDSATSGDDYAAVAAFDIVIAAGAMSGEKTFSLDPTDDALDEVEESISVKGVSGTLTVTGASIKLTDDDVPELSITAGAAVDEGTAARFTVNASPAPAEDLTVNLEVATSAGFAVTNTTGDQSFTFSAGGASQTYTVATRPDTTDEADGQVEVTLDAGSGYTIHASNNAASVAVNDDDPTSVILTRAGSGGIAEDGGTEDITITLGRELVAGESVTVPLEVSGATAATHYTIGLKGNGGAGVTIDTGNPHNAGNPAVTIAGAGAQTATLTLTAVANNDRDTRTANIAFGTTTRAPTSTGLSGGIRATGSAAITIIDDDATITVTDASAAEGSAVVFTVSLPENAPSGGVTVGYSTSNGRGNESDETYQIATGGDYTAAAQNAALTIAAGASTGTISIATRQDTTYEGDHHFTLTLESTSFFNISTTAGSAIGTITDAQDTPSFAFSSASSTVAESVGTVTLTVERTGTTLVPATITYATTDGTAAGGSDFTAITATDLAFAAGDTSKTFDVTITNDTGDELTESFSVDLSAKSHAKTGTDASHAISITDNDQTTVTLSALASPIAENGGTKIISVTLGRALAGDETLAVPLTFSGDATFGDDYTLAEPNATPTGVTYSNLASTDLAKNPPAIAFSGVENAASSATLILTGADDSIDEGAVESVSLGLGALVPANLDGGARGTGTPGFTITDDDNAPGGITLTTSVASIAEDAATATVTVTATVTGGSAYATATTVAVEVGADNDSAFEGTDYATVAGFDITIDAGKTVGTNTFTLNPDNDDIDEDTETISVTGLSGDITIVPASIDLTDNDTRGVTITPTALTLDETDTSGTEAEEHKGTYRVVLTSEPTDDVTVEIGVPGGAPFTLSKSELDFTPSNWNSVQTVTVTASDDDVDNTGDRRTADITHTVDAGDSDYGGVDAPDVEVTVNDDDGTPVATLLLAPASINESGTSNRATVTARLNRASEAAVTLEVAAAPVSPAAAADIAVSQNKTLTIAAGSTVSTGGVTITATDNAVDALDKTFTVSATASGGGVAAPANQTLTIVDDEATTVTLARTGSGGIAENAGEVDVTITLGRTLGAGETVTVPLVVSGADESDHYTLALKGNGGTGVSMSTSNPHSAQRPAVTLSGAGARTATLTLTAVANSDRERRTVSIAYGTSNRAPSSTGLSGGISTLGTVSVPINDDDAMITVASASAAEGSAVEFTVSLPDPAPPGGVTIDYSTANGRGNEDDESYQIATGTDYTQAAANASLQISATQSSGVIRINTTQDSSYEGDHHFTLSLDATDTLNISPDAGSATGTITDAADLPSFAFTTAATAAGEDAGNLTLTVQKTGTTEVPATVSYKTTDGSATGGSDFTAIAATDLAFAAADTSKTITVTVTDDSTDEVEEAFSVDLSAGDHARLGTTASHTVTITDNDPTPVTLSATGTAIAEDGGAKAITVTLGRALTGSETLSAALTFGGDATFGTDYTLAGPETAPTGVTFSNLASTDLVAKPPTIAFSGVAGAASSATLTLTASDDAIDEGAGESVTLGIGTLAPANLDGGASRSGAPGFTITDDDAAPSGITLTTDTPTIAEDAATKMVTVTATVNNGGAYTTDTTVAVEVGAPGDSASEGVDYADVAGFDITITAGAMSAQGSFSLDPTDDSLDEDDETISVKGTSGGLGITGASIGLADNDNAPVLSIDAPSVAEGASGSGATLRFTVTLTPASGRQVTVAWAEVSGGTATPGTDYTALTGGTLTFAAGDTTRHIDIAVTGDDIDEESETVRVRLSSPSNATLAGGNASLDGTGTIGNDDQAGVTVTGDELGAGALIVGKEEETVIRVSLASEPVADVTVSLTSEQPSIADLSASPRGPSVDLTFTPTNWSMPQAVTVHGKEDGMVVITTTVTSTDPQYRKADVALPRLETRVAAIPSIIITADAAMIREGEPARFTLTADRAPAADLPVRINVGYGCCLGNGRVLADGQEGVRTVIVPQDETTVPFEVETVDDGVRQLNEILEAKVLPGAGYRGGNGATVIVADNDPLPDPGIRVSIAAPASVMEGGALPFTLTASKAPERDLPVSLNLYAHSIFAYVPGPAVRTVRHDPEEERREIEVILPAGQTGKVFEVTLPDDNARQGHGTMVAYVGFSPDNGYRRADHPDNRAEIALIDDETRAGESAISVADVEVREGPGAALEFVATLERRPGANGQVRAFWRLRDGTATAGEDYQDMAGMVRFQPGETEFRVHIQVFEDAKDEGDETLVFELYNAGPGGWIERGEALGTIRDAVGASASAADQAQQAETGPQATACIPASVLADVGDYVEETQHGDAHVARWQRVLDAFAGTPGGMTAAGAREMAAQYSASRWDPVAAALGCMETAASWWGALSVEARVRALYGTGLGAEEQAGRKAAVATRYTSLDPETRALAAGAAVGLIGAGAHESLAAWWDGLDCSARRVAVGAGNVADAASPWCRAWSALDDTHRPEALRIGRALFGAGLPATLSNDVEEAGVLNVADAQAVEGPGAALSFAVRLTGAPDARTQEVTVAYATRDGTATAGADYEAVAGRLVFAPGETEKTVAVAVHDDGHDEGEETMTLMLSDPEGAALGDAEATGTIVNTDAMPEAWLARFGRAVAEQLVESVSERFGAPRRAGFEGRFAGQTLGASAPVENDTEAPGGIGAWPGEEEEEDGTAGSRATTMAEMLMQSDFTLTGAGNGSGGSWALWARASERSFDGADGPLSLDGTVTTGLFGMDFAREGWIAGAALTHSKGEGGYTLQGGAGGAVETVLTAFAPYAHVRIDDSRTAWGVLGIGEGRMTLTPESEAGMAADLDWRMAAVGLADALVQTPVGGGFGLSAKMDALWAHTASGAAPGLVAAHAGVTRLRLGLEGSWTVALEGGSGPPGSSLTPNLELGMRHDGGDAETGFGVELGGGLAWVDPRLGLNLDLSGRTLVAHGDDKLKDRGFTASLAFDPDPASVRGLSLSLSQDWGGSATGGLDALFTTDPLGERSGGGEEESRWQVEAAYGFRALGGRFTGSPHVGFGLATGAHDYTLGWRLTPAGNALDFSLGLKATRRESDAAPPEHRLGAEVNIRW